MSEYTWPLAEVYGIAQDYYRVLPVIMRMSSNNRDYLTPAMNEMIRDVHEKAQSLPDTEYKMAQDAIESAKAHEDPVEYFQTLRREWYNLNDTSTP